MCVLALLNIIIALSWFGVNLLGVGLHAYGFTQTLAGGLALFCIFAFLAAMYVYVPARCKAIQRDVKKYKPTPVSKNLSKK